MPHTQPAKLLWLQYSAYRQSTPSRPKSISVAESSEAMNAVLRHERPKAINIVDEIEHESRGRVPLSDR